MCNSGVFQKRHEGSEIKFTCARASCGHSASSSEVSLRLQQLRDDLEEAVSLMESHRPGE